jgi:glucosamine-6-phosphate deaminase
VQFSLFENEAETAKNAAAAGASLINAAISRHGEAHIILATGASQFALLEVLTSDPDIDWSQVTVFHLDEYVGIDETHPASFVRYLRERFLARIPGVKEMVFIKGNTGDTDQEIARVSKAISSINIDVAFVGIGENGHLAFNDPPADFKTTEPYICVELDRKCRQQQASEGWFPTLDDVPTKAISMSVHQIMKSAAIICTVPDRRKAQAVKWTIEGEVSNLHPASILQNHDAAYIFLDKEAASQLSGKPLT